jgi:hypothetical protein
VLLLLFLLLLILLTLCFHAILNESVRLSVSHHVPVGFLTVASDKISKIKVIPIKGRGDP